MSNTDPHTVRDMPERYWNDEDNPAFWEPGEEKGDVGRPADVSRARGPAERALTEEIIAWRPMAVYVGDISAGATLEVGLGSPPVGGALLRRVTMRVRADFSGTCEMNLQRRDTAGERTVIATQTTDAQALTAHLLFEIYHTSSGIRFEPNHELTLAYTLGGTGLTGVTLYPDWYVGI